MLVTPSIPVLSDVEISRRYRLVGLYFLGLVAMVFTFTVLYNTGMKVLEGDPQDIFHSFQIVIETMTTTGYGADSPWGTPAMNMFVVLMQLAGIGTAFFTLRLIVIPLFTSAEANLENRLPPKRDHVIVCEYRRDSSVLLDELESLGIEYVIVSPSREEAESLSNDGYAAIHGSPESADAYERASIDTARAVVTDAGDATVGAILTVRSIDDEIDLFALSDDSEMRDVLLDTGADAVLSPHRDLGKRLANKAVSTMQGDLTDAVDLGAGIELAEVQVHHGSDLAGTRLRNAGLGARTGVTVIGAWVDGELAIPPRPETVLSPNTVLVVAAQRAALADIAAATRPVGGAAEHDRIVIAGFGEVGQAAAEVVESAGYETVTIDRDDGPGVDVVGSVGKRAVLEAADVEAADAIVVAVPDDSTALLATVLARSIDPTVEILTRVRDAESTEKALAAGADYVLSVPRVSARLIAAALGETPPSVSMSAIDLVQVTAAPFAGQSLAETGIAETGCRVVSIQTADQVVTGPKSDRTFTGEETITVVGTGETLAAFLERYDLTPMNRDRSTLGES
jgi:Trk K+ transport system NAD-binding subunit